MVFEVNKTHNIDCITGMRMLEENSIDLIITSPPYNNYRNRRTQKSREEYWKRTNINYDNFSDDLSDEDYEKWQIEVINEMLRVLKPTGTICYNHKDRIFNFEVTSPLLWIFKSNAIYRQRVTWDRCGMQQCNPVRFYRFEEDIYILGKETKGFKWNKEGAKYQSIWRIPATRKNGHPCSFPEELVRRCIESFSDENDIILDPFMGSGTTGKVALENKRNFIGFEISENYCNLANGNNQRRNI